MSTVWWYKQFALISVAVGALVVARYGIGIMLGPGRPLHAWVLLFGGIVLVCIGGYYYRKYSRQSLNRALEEQIFGPEY